jgi:CheY-like chemotaxis protein
MKQIVILDDSRTIIAGLQMVLKEVERSGLYKFHFFNDPIGFSEMIKHEATEFDFFFLDINMPGMSGLEVAGIVRSIPKYAKTPIFALTTEDGQKIQELGVVVGMDGWIVKSTTPGMVREQIRKTLGDWL